MADQGSCFGASSQQATNVFGTCSTNDFSQIYSDVASFNYSSDVTYLPDCVNSNLLPNDCFTGGIDINQVCPQAVTDPCASCVIILKAQFDNTPIGFEHSKVKGELIRKLLQTDSIVQLISVLNTDYLDEDKMMLIPLYIYNQNYALAHTTLNDLDLIKTEQLMFYQMFNVLLNVRVSGRNLDSISVNEKEILLQVANSGTACALMAQGVIAEINNTNYLRFPQQITRVRSGNSVDSEPVGNELSIFPNPNNGEFTLEYEFTENSNVIIINSLGQIVKTIKPQFGQNFIKLDNLSKGMYSVRLIDEKNKIISTTFIIQ